MSTVGALRALAGGGWTGTAVSRGVRCWRAVLVYVSAGP